MKIDRVYEWGEANLKSRRWDNRRWQWNIGDMKKEGGALPEEEGTREKGWGYRGWAMEDEES